MKDVIIMGAGPAGLAAGYRLGKNQVGCTLLEMDKQVGGISKTIKYKGYYFDLGGHRFFTKLDEVNKLWHEVLKDDFKRTPRLSRIYYKNKFFNYPLTAVNAIVGMGVFSAIAILFSYFKARLFPQKEEKTFEQWVSNRFGEKLYSIFFKTYTEKVWGIPCTQIQAEWAAQRIKGLSLKTAVMNALFRGRKNKIKTLINEFEYPVRGPGMMYDKMKDEVLNMGGSLLLTSKVIKVNHKNNLIKSVEYLNSDGVAYKLEGSDFLSSIPITELIKSLSPAPPENIIKAAEALRYRSIITVDVIVEKEDLFPDNWIYVHSPEVKLGRIQNFKNWSCEMVPDKTKTSLGLEYFCDEGDEFWSMPDEKLFELAKAELEKIKICKRELVKDYIVVRVPKAYPVYMTGYKKHIETIKEYLMKFKNLQLIGRYGLFKYNNMDHSILTGLFAAENIIHGKRLYDTWEVNTEEEYHEEREES